MFAELRDAALFSVRPCCISYTTVAIRNIRFRKLAIAIAIRGGNILDHIEQPHVGYGTVRKSGKVRAKP